VGAPVAVARPGEQTPFDLDAAVAAAAKEADRTPFRFTWHGEDYEMPNQSLWPLAAIRAFATGDLDAALEGIMGEASVNKLTAAGFTLGALEKLFDEAGQQSGMGNLPNSGPPPARGSTRR
jgi:hypothetical protein